MRIKSFTITNYRSIKEAYNIPLDENMTVLIGKNNEGKSNILRALSGAFYIIDLLKNEDIKYISNYVFGRRLRNYGTSWNYDWIRDFPVTKQKRSPNGTTKFRINFILSKKEQEEFSKTLGLHFNENLPLEIILSKKEIITKIPKRSHGSTNKKFIKKINNIAKFISQNLDSIYIPAIRPAEASMEIIEKLIDREVVDIAKSRPEYEQAQKLMNSILQTTVDKLSQKISVILSEFIPNVKNVQIDYNEFRRISRRMSAEIKIDDGVNTSLYEKGDGLKSLIALSLMQGTRNEEKDLTIAVEEPEAHLHPEAIRRVKDILLKMSKSNQIIVSTHSPILVNNNKLSSNIIVRNNKAEPVENIRQIREELGIAVSDNLYNAENILLVEGTTDVRSLTRLLCKNSEKICTLIKDGSLAIKPIAGVHNLSACIKSYQSFLCKNIYVYIDHDKAANDAKTKVLEESLIQPQYLLQTIIKDKDESEFEDLINRRFYNKFFTEPSLQDWCSHFDCKKYKWSENVKKYYEQGAITLTDTRLNEIKNQIANKIENADLEQSPLINEYRTSFDALIKCIENTI